ncbi:hypothetical protein RRG08_064484 [Elysia crispata]|uniref:Uncharacterized protein n=1 Tax=Elysia crispata TaxID=231223 RepID=A0AAE1DXR8_9GAST|nr:hypothetical protein RRG08_064484 [Elysia crispata]
MKRRFGVSSHRISETLEKASKTSICPAPVKILDRGANSQPGSALPCNWCGPTPQSTVPLPVELHHQ